MFPVRMKSTGVEIIIYKQCAKTSSRACIPHLQLPVIGGRHNEISQWTDRTPTHLTRMPTKRESHLSRTRIPHLECLITRGRHDKVFCWTDRTPLHLTRMPAK